MIYTIGNRDSYQACFEKHPQPLKRGRDEDEGYEGGSVWQTFAEAAAHLKPGYNVYGVLADWETETEPSGQGGNWHDLLVDAPLVKLEVRLDAHLELARRLFKLPEGAMPTSEQRHEAKEFAFRTLYRGLPVEPKEEPETLLDLQVVWKGSSNEVS